MAFLQLTDVNLSFGARDILKSVSVYLKSNSKVALTGSNGAGKSTLIKVLSGEISPDSGSLSLERGARVAYLPQSGLVHKGKSLVAESECAFGWGHEIQKEIDLLGEKGSSDALERQALLIERLNNSTFPRRRAVIEGTLLGLGFKKSDFDKPCETFSGGWQMRIALAKVLMENADILLLDEPTNYLDIEARGFLEGFLQSFSGAFLIVSHDRYFLDVTINEVYELFNGEVLKYKGNYSHYEKVRAQELETLKRQYKAQQDEITKLEDFINRFGAKATKAAQAQDRQKRLDKLLSHPIILPESAKVIHFQFPPCPHSPNVVLSIKFLNKSYGTNAVIKDLSLVVGKGERLVVTGRNGAGKSTLLRIIAGEDENYTGSVTLGAGVKIGYFSQDSTQKIAGKVSVLDFIESHAPLSLVPRVRDMLGAFLFCGDDVYKALDVLSGGEKTRVALLLLLLSENNLLILDEATNHLDLHSKDVLSDAIKSYGGAVLFVSHDRGFSCALATKVLELNGGTYSLFPGTYDEYLSLKAANEAPLTLAPPAQIKKDPPPDDEKAFFATGKEDYAQKKAREAQKRKYQKDLLNLENAIKALEDEKKSLEDSLALPEVYTNGPRALDVQHKIASIAEDLSKKEEEWLSLSEGEFN